MRRQSAPSGTCTTEDDFSTLKPRLARALTATTKPQAAQEYTPENNFSQRQKPKNGWRPCKIRQLQHHNPLNEGDWRLLSNP
jgi:hypothetical protein